MFSDQPDLQRIEDMENKFNEVSRVVAALEKALDEYAAIKACYMISWMRKPF